MVSSIFAQSPPAVSRIRAGNSVNRHRSSEALAAMPGNTAVQGPDAGIVERPCDGHEPVRRHRGSVAAR